MKENTIVFLLNRDSKEILLAMKKRGFGAGKMNGVGGKIEKGESVRQAAVREAKEEIGVTIAEEDLVSVADLSFHFLEKSDWDIHAHVFFAHTWTGIPEESEEMQPEWIRFEDIPYEKMWIDDQYWLPLVLKGDVLKATFYFANDGAEVARYSIEGIPAAI